VGRISVISSTHGVNKLDRHSKSGFHAPPLAATFSA
jgi:hypothetical protein